MIPSAFVTLESLSLTPNGKIDRRALSQLSVSNYQLSEKTFVAPRTPDEELLAGIWAEVLGIERVGVHDNFFDLGGHSLLATQVMSRLRDTFEVELSLRELFESPTIAGLNKNIQAARQQSPLPPIMPVNRSKPLRLSFAQQRLWFLNQLEGASATYNIPAALRFDGRLNQKALSLSLQTLVQRHENLRTTFPTVDGTPVVQISEKPFQLGILDLRALSPEEQEPQVQRMMKEDAICPFDLETGPLFRALLLQLSATSQVLLVNMHHIISDGWSIGVFIREWRVLYEAALKDKVSPLPPLPIQYVDFAHWQRQWLTGDVLEQQVNYWKQQLIDVPALLELPTDNPRPPVQRFQGANLPIVLKPELTLALKHLSQKAGTTLFMTLWSAFATLLSRLTQQSDIVIGSPIANRTQSVTESLIGFFVNTLVLRLDLSDNPPFENVLQQARRVALEAYSHQDIPFEQLVEALQPVRALSHSPLFQVMFVLQNASIPDLELAGLSLTVLELENVTAKFDLTLSLTETTSGLSGTLEYNTDLFERATIERLSGHLQILLTGIVENPNTPIHELPLLSAAEHQQLFAWNDTATDYPQDQCIHQLFEAQAETTPEAVAVVFEDQQLTYRELNSQANQLAHYLQTLGVKPEVLVGICVERSISMVIGLFGILKAGGAYLPLDPAYPEARLAFMLEDAGVPVLLTQENLTEKLPETKASVVCLDVEAEALSQYRSENVVSGVTPTNLAYVIYTSGSTGKPKGVLIAHQGLCNLAQAQIKLFHVQDNSRILQFASLSFDASIWEIVMGIGSGARLCLAKSDNLLPGPTLVQLLRKNAITHVTLPPTALAVLPIKDELGLQYIIVAGESCSPELAAGWSKGQRFFNAYGPTEGTVCATVFENTAGRLSTLPIGSPIANTQTYILDPYLQPLPVGVPGELHIGGVGLARGYLNRPDLTVEKFIKNPFSENPNSRLYKTGDLARYIPDGNIEYLGRIDNQVKIRGFRIELGEIEAVLGQHVQENAVIVHEVSTTDKRLVAYLVPHQGQVIENTALRGFLNERLPDYMIPSAFVTLESLPLMPNGKIDRRALSKNSVDNYQLSEETFVAPRTPDEELLVDIWVSVLGVERVGVHDNFFELGGHSLLAVQLVSRLRSAFSVEFSLHHLFESPTIASSAECITILRTQIEAKTAKQNLPLLVPIKTKGTQCPLFCVTAGHGDIYVFEGLAKYLDDDQPFYGLNAPFPTKATPFTTSEIAARYVDEVRTVQPTGPYRLGGYCFGGTLAFEMAQQFQAQGQTVELLVLLDVAFKTSLNQKLFSETVRKLMLMDTTHLSLKDKLFFNPIRNLLLKYWHLDENNPEHVRMMNNVFKDEGIRTHELAVRNYVPQPYPGSIVFFWGQQSQSNGLEMCRQWQKVAGKGINFITLPGNHDSFVRPPNAASLVKALESCIGRLD